MRLIIDAFENGKPIPHKFAFCVPGKEGPVDMGKNISPKITWTEAPPETKSFALVLVDPDVPSKPDDVNQEGKTVPKELPRVDFHHLLLCNIPSYITVIEEGELSDGITPKGKDYGETKYGLTGLNNYTEWFKGDENMEGLYGSYDGPCPPWNDSIIHRYFFRLYALDVENLNVRGNYNAEDLYKAMEGHILAEASHLGTYTLNKELL